MPAVSAARYVAATLKPRSLALPSELEVVTGIVYDGFVHSGLSGVIELWSCQNRINNSQPTTNLRPMPGDVYK